MPNAKHFEWHTLKSGQSFLEICQRYPVVQNHKNSSLANRTNFKAPISWEIDWNWIEKHEHTLRNLCSNQFSFWNKNKWFIYSFSTEKVYTSPMQYTCTRVRLDTFTVALYLGLAVKGVAQIPAALKADKYYLFLLENKYFSIEWLTWLFYSQPVNMLMWGISFVHVWVWV